MAYINTSSTVKLQEIINNAKSFADIEPVVNVAGSSVQRVLNIANDVMNAICSTSFPWKWNEFNLPTFITNSFQQDYAGIYPDGTSITTLGWLERGIVIDINNSAQPKPYRIVEVGRQLPQATATFWNSATNNPYYLVNYFPNYILYYGTWGEANTGNESLGNNPVAGSVYTYPFVPNGSQPANPINQIQDANGNLLVLTTYGTEGTSAPLLPANSSPGLTISGAGPSFTFTGVTAVDAGVSGTYSGTIAGGASNAWKGLKVTVTGFDNVVNNGTFLCLASTSTELILANTAAAVDIHAGSATSTASTVWTVVDPYGQGFRVVPVPTQTGLVWQFYLTGQKRPIRFTSLNQTLAPLPDEYEPNFRQMFVAQCYRYAPEAKTRQKFHDEWALAMKALVECRTKADRELEENVFTPDRGVMGGTQGRTGKYYGPQWPWNYPLS